VGDRLFMGKPPRRRTRHPGLLSLSLSERLPYVYGNHFMEDHWDIFDISLNSAPCTSIQENNSSWLSER